MTRTPLDSSLPLVLALVLPLVPVGVLTGCGSDDRADRSSDGGAGGRAASGLDSGSGARAESAGGASAGGQAASGAGVGGAAGAGGAPRAGAGGATSSGGSSGGSSPTACAASDEGNVMTGKDVPGQKAVSSLTYTNVGASGAYAQVVSGWSKATGCVGDTNGNLCDTQYRKPKQVSGPLAPFDEEMSLVFRGPVELYQIAIYSPGAAGWARDAYWDRCVTEGLAFAGNKSWYECGGNVESYVNADGTAKSGTAVQFSGKLAVGTEVNVMSSALCSGSTADSDCGWSSGLPLHGFKGDAAGSKMCAAKFRMPLSDKKPTPAYWILPSQVIRSSQYGCNCRGAGSDPVYKGGCGELDVAEVLVDPASLDATTTLYSFQGITGGGDSVAFNRPVEDAAVFLVIFDAPSKQIAIRRLGVSDFDFAGTVPDEVVKSLLADTGTVRALK